ncbi:hypothetical protein ACFL1N_14310 [Thermodesulfobacteriota bacterium]
MAYLVTLLLHENIIRAEFSITLDAKSGGKYLFASVYEWFQDHVAAIFFLVFFSCKKRKTVVNISGYGLNIFIKMD